MPLAVLRAGTRYEVRGPMTAVLWASGVVQGAGLAKTLRGRSAALSRELADLERLAEPHWRLESLAAPLAPKKMCVGARALRARSAALSKVIVRTEQNNFAGGGAVAGLVLRAPVEQMLWAPKTHHDILYRMLRTRQKAAPRRSPESWGAQNVPRNCAGKCRNAAGGRTVCAAAGARWEDRRQHSQPAAVSITLCTALPACGREHHPVYSTPGVRP